LGHRLSIRHQIGENTDDQQTLHYFRTNNTN